MTGKKVKAVALGYAVFLESHGAISWQRCMEPRTFLERVGHLRWMCEQIRDFVDAGRIDKAFRWLGFVQGSLWALGLYSVEDAKRDNMPADATFDKDRV